MVAGRGQSKQQGRHTKSTMMMQAEPSEPLLMFIWLVVRGATHNNLKNIDVEIPLGRFVCVTGVSGSGKSSLVNDIIREQLARDLNGAEKTNPGGHRAIDGKDHLDKVIDIDQSPIGRTPRSNPATYIKVFDEIRRLYAKLPDSKVRGYAPGRFSFNVPTGEKGGGRCEACEGNGSNRVEMDFLADVWTQCPVCEGKRFNHETLQIHYRGKSIFDVLDMDVQEALTHFDAIPKIKTMLSTLHDVGLDYLKLGQSSTTLSGGEAQRIKLARELVKRSTGRTLYLLDEPTTGLHFDDIRKLLSVLHGFVDAGNTVVVIEHNLDVIKTADWVIDLGPEGGEGGGEIVAAGTPEDVAACPASYTGQSLREVLPGFRRVKKAATGSSAKRKATRRNGPSGVPKHDAIVVVGAKEHNLKDVTVKVPRDAMTVCSGVSGSGKTSFAMDTVYIEGQRRYVESLSAYARQFLGQFQKPKVDHVYGLSPAVAIEQKSASKSPRSTVGTVTEIYDYMRVLWARLGQPYCPRCDIPIGTQSSEEIVNKLVSMSEGTRLLLCAPVECGPGETWSALLGRCQSQGYVRVRIDGKVVDLSSKPKIDARRKHAVELVVDRAVIRSKTRKRIADSVEHCLALGKGVLLAVVVGEDGVQECNAQRFSQHFACDVCGTSYDEVTPHHFSFNTRVGWCPRCEGLGMQRGTSPDAVIVNAERSILTGAIAGWENAGKQPLLCAMLMALASAIGFDPKTPCRQLTAEHRHALLFGLGERWISVKRPALRFQWKGFFPAIDEATKSSWAYRRKLEEMVTDVNCQVCNGGRVRPEARMVRLGRIDSSKRGRSIVEVCAMSLHEAAAFFKSLRLDRKQARVAGELLHEIKSRLRFLIDVGLGYLTLSRSAPTLSGGESQRIRLASQIGSGLTGVLYVLDEPTIGLHPRDNRRLIGALHKLRDVGNTLLMVEHDAEILKSADHLLDFGPTAGADGGHVVAVGAPVELKRSKDSLTGRYLAGKAAIAVPTNRRNGEKPSVLTVVGARQNNLRNIDVSFPLGRFVCVTGVSGSGKSSLVTEILYPALASRIHRARMTPGAHGEIQGIDFVDKVINVDQQPIGNSPSSNPATYTGVFDLIRTVFAKLPESKVRGYTINRFSFNRPGGRCDDCDGMGQVCHEMHFLPDVWVPCETCGGSRYQHETLQVRYKGKNVADVLNMQVSEALELFTNVPKVRRLLQTLEDVGLGYLPLGQSAPTLSGGEAQRVKLAGELGRPSTGKTMYILDEPTTGLHFDDLRKLLDVLHRLVDMGNSVICIEHNLDVIKTADWVVDLGPEAGDEGGLIVAEGPPERIAKVSASHTGRLLKKTLAAGPRSEREVFDAKKAAAEAAAIERSRLVVGDHGPIKMPWQRDGRRWHTELRRSRDDKAIEWEGKALLYVVDQIEKLGKRQNVKTSKRQNVKTSKRQNVQKSKSQNNHERDALLLSTDWSDRARVEIIAKAPDGVAQSAVPWFLHALTAGRWLLDLSFRVPKGIFAQRPLSAKLKLKTLNERDDIQSYGDAPRVQIRPALNQMDQVRIMVYDKKEIDTPAFRDFLKAALSAYLKHVEKLADRSAGAEPWKKDGKTWHMSQKSITPNQPREWRPLALMTFLGRVNKILPNVKTLWNRKVFVELTTAENRRVGKIITNNGHALRVDLHVPRGRFTPTQVERLGREQEMGRSGTSGAELSFWFRSIDEIDAGKLKVVLQAAYSNGSDQ